LKEYIQPIYKQTRKKSIY